MEIKIIKIGTPEYEAMTDLRMKVLLNPIGIPRSYIDPEREKTDILIGAFEGEQMIGCCILSSVDDQIIQLRQMAVDLAIQKKGIGKAIVSFSEKLSREKGYTSLMMNARDTVLGFYQKCGYKIVGEQFFEVGIGHHRMEKSLTAGC